MAEAFVQLPPDSTGKKIRSFENTIGGNVVESQALTLVDAAGNIIASLASAPAGGERAVAVRPIESDVTASGTITATDLVVAAPDGSGQLVSGASTAGSLVSIALPGGDASIVVQVTGLTAGSLYFEGSIDSTTGSDGHWTALQCQRVGIPGRASFVATANGIFRSDASALSYVRVRAVGALTGTPAVSLRVSDATPAVLVDGARTTLTGPLGDEIDTVAGALSIRPADVDAVQGDPGQRARVTAGAYKTVPFTSYGDGSIVFDAGNYASVGVYLSAAAGTVQSSCSVDGRTWNAYPLVNVNQPNATTGATLSAGVIYSGNLPARYFRISLAGTAGATVTGFLQFFAAPRAPSAMIVAQSAAGNLNATVTGATTAGDGGAWSNSILGAAALALGYNGATWDRLRTPSIFKTATATASGDTVLWTPSAGKKFRLMRYTIQATSDAATASGADIDVVLRDATTGLAAAFTFFAPAVAGTVIGTAPGTPGWIDLGNGILSALANNALNINLSATLSSGKVRVVAAGTEE